MPSSKVYAAGARVTVAANELTTDKSGVGTGWNTKPDGSGTSYYGGEELTLNADTTLYATWALPQRILDSAEAAQAIDELLSEESVDIMITGPVDFDSLKKALTSTFGKVGLDLTAADPIATIDSNAFQGATGLVSVTLPSTVTSIGDNAFAGSGLNSLVLKGNATSISIEDNAIPEGAKIYVPHAQLEEYKSRFDSLKARFESSLITVTVKWTGAGTSGFQTTWQGDIGTFTNIPQTPESPANFTFVKWVDDEGTTVTLPPVFKENLSIQANATFVNAAGYPVYPAYLAVQHTSYTAAEGDDVGQKKPDWADKIYSQQLVKRPITNPYFSDVFKFGDGSKQTPERSNFTVTTGDQGGEQTGAKTNDGKGGSFRIPAMTSIQVPGVGRRIFAAMDMRYRGREDGNGDCGTDYGGSDTLIMYSDDAGATWTKKVIDVDNTWSETGQSNPMTRKTDIGDPALWTVGTDVYVGGVGGSAIGPQNSGGRYIGEESTTRVFKSSDYGETWVESTDISQDRYTYAYNWNTMDGKLTNPGKANGYANLPCPGHGIVLTKDVPGTPMKAGMTAVPMQGGNSTFATYIAYGSGDPSSWSNRGSLQVPDSGNGEWQICQMDDGTILALGKSNGGSIHMRRYKDDDWYTVSGDPWGGGNRGASQTSLLKVADGDGSKKGVVAFASPKESGANNNTDFDNIGRNQVTVSFAADESESAGAINNSPLGTNRYYVQIRKMGQRYFGYTDMVMVDDQVIGILYECFDKDNNDLDGMRFIMLDASEVIKKLSKK